MKTMFKAALLAAALTATPSMAQTLPPAVIVIVDYERVLTTSAAGKQAQTELKTKAEALQARVQQLRTQFGSEEQAMVKSRPTAAGPAVAEWEKKVRDMNSRRETAEKEVAQRERDLQATVAAVRRQIGTGSEPIISTVMRERGASIVLAEGATLQHAASIDVTTDVIARLDKALPRVSTATPAAPAAAPR